jgi:hypothetical protein
MADRYVNPAVGASGTGGSWAQAYKTLKEATDAAAAGETIYFANGTADVIGADTTYTLANGVRVISTSDTTNSPPTTYATGATVSTTTGNVDVTINGVGCFYGVNITLGDATDANTIVIGSATNSAITFDSCAFTFGGSGTASLFGSGVTNDVASTLVCRNCSWSWGNSANRLRLRSSSARFIGCDFSAGATHPTTLFNCVTYVVGAGSVEIIACDLSDISTVFDGAPVGGWYGYISQSKLKASATIFAPTNYGYGDVYVYDSSDGDSHVHVAHYNYEGSTVCSTSVYCNDNIADSNLSWVVSSTANASRATPYKSPWLDVYHEGTSAITPYLECLRSGSTTAYKESELWSEWLVKATSGSTRATLYSNELGPLATTGNNESSSKGASDWTGEHASDNWYGKLQPNAAVTPAEAGHIRARVCLGVASSTVYVDPQIRGLA